MATTGASSNNDQLREAKDLLEQLNKLKRQLGEKKLEFGDTELVNRVKDLPNDIRRARKELEDMEGTASDLYGRLRGVTSEFKYQVSTLGKVRGAFRQLEDAAQNLKYDEQGISDLNTSQLRKLQEKVAKNKEILGQEARKLINESTYARILQTNVTRMTQQKKSQTEINDFATKYLSNIQSLKSEEKSLLQLYFDQKDTVSDINNKIHERIEQEKEVSRLLGVGGAAIGGLSAFMGKLGMNSGIFRDAVDEANEKMRDTAKNIQAGTQSGGRLTVLMAGLGPLARGFGRALLDPATIILKIVDGFFEVNKAAVEYQRLTGQNAVATAGMNSSLATSVDVLTTMAEITKQTGLSATSIFSPADLGRLAEAKNLLGLSGEQATNLGLRSKLTGQSIDGYQKSIVTATNKYNKLNGTAVAHGVVMQDVLNTSDEIALSLGGDAARISAANTAARGLGLTLEKVDQIAGSILQFEDSIGKELEAELLTGKNLNLEKAREFALTGNLAGLSDELKKNGASAAEFAGMNRIEQEALAAALGMSRQELAKTVMTQENSKNLTEEQRAAAIGVSVEQMRSMDIQERMNKSLDKLAQAFAPILEALVPIAEALASVILPIASVVGSIASGVSGLIKPLMIVYGIYKGIQAVMVASLAIGRANYALKALQMGQEAFITREKGTQGLMDKQSLASRLLYNGVLLVQLIREQGIAGLKTFANTLDDKSIAKKIILKGFELAEIANLIYKNGLGMAELGTRGAIAAAASVTTAATASQLAAMPGLVAAQGALAAEATVTAGAAVTANAAATFGLGTLAIVGALAAVAGATAAYFAMKDGVIDPKKGPVMSGDFGSVQLDPNDKAMYGADGKIKVGTDLIGNKTGKAAPTTISSVVSTKQESRDKEVSLLEKQINLLSQLVNKDTSINFDSNKANRFSTLASYKLS